MNHPESRNRFSMLCASPEPGPQTGRLSGNFRNFQVSSVQWLVMGCTFQRRPGTLSSTDTNNRSTQTTGDDHMTSLKAALITLAAGTAIAMTLAAAPARAMGADHGVTYLPGINCKTDFGPAVDTICAHTGLLALDRRIADRYSEALDQAGRFGQWKLKRSQHKFLAQRDDCRADKSCLRSILEARVVAIRVK
jgi:hypothetical protein